MQHEQSHLFGEHKVNKHPATEGQTSLYDSDTDRVVLYRAEKNFVGIILLNEDGRHIGQMKRRYGRVEEALSGEPGYDILVNE